MLALPEYPFHEIAEIFPLMVGQEFDALVKDIAENGQREHGWMYQGRIIDGRNRYRASRKAGKPFLFREWDGNGSLVEFVASLNLHRRHLTDSQRAVVAAKLKTRFEAEAKGRQAEQARRNQPNAPESQKVANLPPLEKQKSRDAAAREMSVSPRTVEAASKVLRDGVPDLVKVVESGAVAVSAAAEVARMPKEEQQAVVDAGPTAIVKHAAQAREDRKPEQVQARRTAATSEPAAPRQWSAAGDEVFNSPLRRILNEVRLAGGISKYVGDMTVKQRADAVKKLRSLISDIESWIEQLEAQHV